MKAGSPLPGRGHTKGSLALTSALVALLSTAPALGQTQADVSDPSNIFGSRGVIATPSARLAPDGELSVGASFLRNNQHYNTGFQILPWLEGSFKYSGLQHFQADYPVYYDRSFGIKARLWKETDIFPAVAIGIDDIVGTGVYNGEYIVASKRFGDIDTSLGMGWGRRASTALFENPLALAFPSFKNRKSFFGQAGGADFSAFFHGEKVGLFGGAVWHTPLNGLSLLIEYDSDRYLQEKAEGNFSARSQVNYGLAYDLTENVSVGLDWLYGTTLGGSFSVKLDPVHAQYPQKLGAPPPEVVVRSEAQQQHALLALRSLQNPDSVRQRGLFQSRNAERNAFVDALWLQAGDYSNIEVRKNTLELTVTGAVSNARCQKIAQLIMGVAVDIGGIRLSNAGQRVSCAIPRSIKPSLINADFQTSANAFAAAVPIPTIDATDVENKVDLAKAERAIRADATKQQIQVVALAIGETELVLYYRNYHYFSEIDAINRLTRLLTADAPPGVEKFRLIAVQNSVPVQEFTVLRGPIERSDFQNGGDIFDQLQNISAPPLNNPVLSAAQRADVPRFDWGIFPQMRQALFDPDQPFGVQFLADAYASAEILPGLNLNGSFETSLYDDFNTNRPSDSQLPHVRSDFLKYFTRGKTGIGSLETDYRFRLSPEVYAIARVGYLESMFAGGGGEVLWRPEGQRWALSVDAYEVWQRNFDRLFGLQHYHQFTGHISLYYDSPWYGLIFQVRAGQYLAGDRGVTLQVTRRFSTGVEIGAFVTKTNVSSEQFGEGSFDKGIIIRLPLGWVVPVESQSQIAFDLRPVQRDGGQVLAGDATLYGATVATSEGEILRQIDSHSETR